MRPIHLVALIALSTIWGASFMFIKVMLDEMTPLAVAWVRLGVGGLVMVAVLVAIREQVPRGRRYWGDVLVVAGVGTAIPYVLIPWGEQQIPSNLAAVLNGATPLWAVILSTMFLPAERLTVNKAIGVALGFSGVALIIGPDALDLTSASTQGQLAIVLAALCYAAGAVYIRRRMLGTSPWMLASAQNFVAFALIMPLVIGAGEVPSFGDLDQRTLLALAGLGVLSQGVGILIYYWLIANVEATQASFVTYLAPIAAQFWGWVVLSETPGAVLIPGMALVIGGMVFLNRRRPTAVPVAETPAAVAGGAE